MPAPNLEPVTPRPPLIAKIAALLVSGSVASLAILQGFAVSCQAVDGSSGGEPGPAAVAAPPAADPPAANPAAPADAPAAGSSTGGDKDSATLIGTPTSSGARYIGGSKSDVDIWGIQPPEDPAVKRKPSRSPKAKGRPEEGAR